MSNHAIVIGSNSFSGAHFVSQILKAGYTVDGVSRSSEINPVFLPYRWEQSDTDFTFHQLDLNKDLDRIKQLVQDAKPRFVVNFAAQSMVGESWLHPEHWFQTNVVSTIKLHDELRKFDFLEKYVHVSTPEVYGATGGLISENVSYNPSTPYAVSRAAADMSLMSFYNTYQFPVVFTRAANVFGPGQQLYRIVPRAILYFLTGKKLQLHGGGRSVRSFIHIGDVARATLKVMELGTPGEIFHFSTNRNISIRKLVELIAARLEVEFEENVEIVGDRPGKDSAYLLDSSKAKEVLGWEPEIELEQGIDETIGWVKDNLNVLTKQELDYVHKQ